MDNQNPHHILKLSQPYAFGGLSYTEIDLSSMEGMTAADMIAAEEHLIREGLFTPEKEDTMEYNIFLASRFSGLPMQFFVQFKPKDVTRLRATIRKYIGEDTEEGNGEQDGEHK